MAAAPTAAAKLGILASPSRSACQRSSMRCSMAVEAHAGAQTGTTTILEARSCRRGGYGDGYGDGDGDGELIQKVTKSAMETAIGGVGKHRHGNISRLAEAVVAVEDEEQSPGQCLDSNAQRWWMESGGSLPSLERILLEARWSYRQEVEWSRSSSPSSSRGDGGGDGLESGLDDSSSTSSGNAARVVRSGRPNARQRRLAAAREQRGEDATSSSRSSMEEEGGSVVVKSPRRSRAVKTERSMKGFVDSYLRNAVSHEMSDKEHLDLWDKIRVAGDLVKEQQRLIAKLGYEPSMHELAKASGLPVRHVARTLSQGAAARKKMILSNLRLVVAVARRYENMGVEIGDLIQEGTLGLIHGLEKFDVSRGYKFSTYAYWWIFQAMIRSLDKRGKCIRYPFHLCETIRKINQLRNKQADEGPVSVETMVRELNIPRAKIEIALQASNYRLTSLDRHVAHKRLFEEGDPLEDFIVDQSDESQPWLMAERDAVKEELDHLLETKLDPREREVIRKRFGLHPKQTSPLSRHEIGRSCGISRERVRQLENDAMAKLRANTEKLSMDFMLQSNYQTILW